MSDLRNRRRKDIERAMIRSMQARLAAAKSNPAPPRCKCGLTPQQVPVMWVINSDKCWEQPDFRCPACLPADLAAMV